MPMKRRVGYLYVAQDIVQPGQPERTLFEADTLTCGHCSITAIKRPEWTGADRAWCSQCDRYICNPCGRFRANGGRCVPRRQREELAMKHQDLALPFMDAGPNGELLFPETLLDKEKVF